MARDSKTPVSLRLEPELVAAVSALQTADESKTQAFSRVLSAGVEALTVRKRDADADAELVTELRRSVDILAAQLDVKDGQISALQDSLRAAQTLHMQAAQHKAIEGNVTPQTAQERAQDVHAAQEPEPAQQSATTQPRRGGIAGAIGRLIWGR